MVVPRLVHPQRMLRLIHESLLGSAVDSLVLAAPKLVRHLLRRRLAVIGLSAARYFVCAARDALFGFLEGGFGRVGGHFLAGLGVEVFAECFGHDEEFVCLVGWFKFV